MLLVLNTANHQAHGDPQDGISILGIDFTPDSRSLLMLIGALRCLAVLLGYATIENVSEWILELTKL